MKGSYGSMKIKLFLAVAVACMFGFVFLAFPDSGKKYKITGNWKSNKGNLVRIATFPKADFLIMISAKENVDAGEAHEGQWLIKGISFHYYDKKENKQYFGHFSSKDKIIIKDKKGKMVDSWVRVKK